MDEEKSVCASFFYSTSNKVLHTDVFHKTPEPGVQDFCHINERPC